MKSIGIIGGGIGGLTTGLALHQKGFNVKIYEQADTLRPVGAGILLANNAMQVYRQLGIHKELKGAGHVLSEMQITNATLKPLSGVKLEHFENKFGVQNIAIHRGALQQILARHIPESLIQLNHKLVDLKQTEDKIKISFGNDIEAETDVLLGADGIHSQVRQILFGALPFRHSHQICWRGVLDYRLPKRFLHKLTEAWGPHSRIGFVQINDHQVYWFAVKTMRTSADLMVEALPDYFAGYHDLVLELLNQTSISSIHTDELYDLKPIPRWFAGKVCLIGDAAHATTPNMGQGAGQSIEDARVMAHCIETFEGPLAFEKFQEIRMAKVHHIVKTSWSIGQMAHWKNPLVRSLRNGMMKLIPESINHKQNEKIFRIAKLG